VKEVEKLLSTLEYGTLPYNGASPSVCQDAIRIINLLVARTRELIVAVDELNKHSEVNEGRSQCGCDGGEWVCPACRLQAAVLVAKGYLPPEKAGAE